MLGPELRAALDEQNLTHMLGSTALHEAAATVNEAEQAIHELIVQAGIETRDILVANEVEPNVRIMSKPKKGLFGQIKIPAQLELEGWELDSPTTGARSIRLSDSHGNQFDHIRSKFLATNGSFYTHYYELPSDPDSKLKPISFGAQEIKEFGVDNLEIAEKLARLLEDVEDTTSQTT